jgi:hypothetical protein
MWCRVCITTTAGPPKLSLPASFRANLEVGSSSPGPRSSALTLPCPGFSISYITVDSSLLQCCEHLFAIFIMTIESWSLSPSTRQSGRKMVHQDTLHFFWASLCLIHHVSKTVSCKTLMTLQDLVVWHVLLLLDCVSSLLPPSSHPQVTVTS